MIAKVPNARKPKHPGIEVQLSGEDGNVFNLIGTASKAARRAGVPRAEIAAFEAEVMAAESYDHALRVIAAWFEVS